MTRSRETRPSRPQARPQGPDLRPKDVHGRQGLQLHPDLQAVVLLSGLQLDKDKSKSVLGQFN